MASSVKKTDHLSGEEVVDLAHFVSGLTRAELPLGPGLKALGQEMSSPRLRRAFDQLATRLEAGAALDEVLADKSSSPQFPRHLRGLVTAGLRTGQLGSILDQFVRYEHIGAELRREFWLSLTYPIILILGVFFLSVFVGTVIVRDISVIYQDFGINLPRATVGIIHASEIFRNNTETLGILATTLGVLFVFFSSSKLLFGESFSRWLAGRLPIIGRVATWTSLAEFFHLLGLLLESGIPLLEALKLAGDGIRDPTIKTTAQRLANEIERGQSFGGAVASVQSLPAGLPSLITWAEGNQSLSETLHLIATMFENRARSYSHSSGILISVIIVTCVVISIGVIVVALFVPMISLISKLSG